MKKGISYILLFTAVLVIAACSSSKKDQSYISRVFHNTSAHYNGYYYAKLKLTEAEKQVISVRRENYEKLLPLYLTGNPDDAFSSNDLDSVVKRLTIAVKLHPKSKWADDCYYNIGKAYYYKKDYDGAQAIFQYVSSEFKADAGTSNSSSSKKKKSSSKKKKTADKNVNKYTGTVKDSGKEGETASSSGGAFSMLKHRPIHYTDVLWLIRAQAMTKKFGEAQAIIAYLQEDKKFPAELKADLALTQTFVFIQQQQFKNATGTLLSVIDQTKNKKEATRYTYILAQLYNLSGDYGSSGKYFAQVSEMRPDYEMDFNARINVVKNYIASGSGSPTQVTASLEEMAKNKNFEEFNDQIYYYLGLVHLFQGKNEEAVKDFETSIARSYANNNQKGLSFLKIGEVSMRDEDYLTAAPYYDSAVAFIDSKFDTIGRVKELNTTLNDGNLFYHFIECGI